MRLGSLLRASARVVKDTNASRLRARKAAITLTPQAVSRIKTLMADHPEMTALKVRFKRFFIISFLDRSERARMQRLNLYTRLREQKRRV
jgi:hypothetical protein